MVPIDPNFVKLSAVCVSLSSRCALGDLLHLFFRMDCLRFVGPTVCSGNSPSDTQRKFLITAIFFSRAITAPESKSSSSLSLDDGDSERLCGESGRSQNQSLSQARISARATLCNLRCALSMSSRFCFLTRLSSTGEGREEFLLLGKVKRCLEGCSLTCCYR